MLHQWLSAVGTAAFWQAFIHIADRLRCRTLALQLLLFALATALRRRRPLTCLKRLRAVDLARGRNLLVNLELSVTVAALGRFFAFFGLLRAVDDHAGLGLLHTVLLTSVTEALLRWLFALLKWIVAVVLYARGWQLLAVFVLILAIALFGRLLTLLKRPCAVNFSFAFRT